MFPGWFNRGGGATRIWPGRAACGEPLASNVNHGLGMRTAGARGVTEVAARLGVLVGAAVLVSMASGCLSNEYRIQRDELRRLASLPPAARGQRVRVTQEVGERRGDAIDPGEGPPPEAVAAGGVEEQSGPSPNVDINIYGSNGGGRAGGGRGSAFRGTPPHQGGGSGGAGWRDSGSGGGGSGWKGGGGGGGWTGGGGGGDSADALVVLAVVLVAVAVVAAVALAAGEGMRFEGDAQLSPYQVLYVKDGSGTTSAVPLGDLTPERADAAVEAIVKDDEGDGIRRMDRAPLDRRGAAFKLELGTGTFNVGTTEVVGPAAHIQLGFFPARSFGILADIGLSGGETCCAPTFTRHSLALELDALPLALGPLHAGGFAKGGVAVAGNAAVRETGPIGGGGALLELDLTSTMALTLRAGVSAAQLESGWSTAGTITGGIAIY
jgi:hypothetical protein